MRAKSERKRDRGQRSSQTFILRQKVASPGGAAEGREGAAEPLVYRFTIWPEGRGPCRDEEYGAENRE
jgi:hypothetical protein